jgi:hypothetical protein
MTQHHTPQTVEEILQDNRTFIQRVVDWFRAEANSWALSLLIHVLLLAVAGLFFGRTIYKKIVGDAPTFDAASVEQPADQQYERFDLTNVPLDPSELSPDTLNIKDPPGQEAVYYNDSPKFEEMGGGSAVAKDDGSAGLGLNLRLSGVGPALQGGGGADVGKGAGTGPGRGGAGTGFGHRGQGSREGRVGGTRVTELAVAGALSWLARHQNTDGTWSTEHFRSRCRDGVCSGGAKAESIFGGTALGLLPFLAAGQTHQTKGTYQRVVEKAVQWLVKNQKEGGGLFDSSYAMYEHGLAAIALCEVYGMTGDSQVRGAAQSALDFIKRAQNKEGGWRYMPGVEDSDTSVFGWEMMAYKSGMMAGLEVDQASMKKGYEWLTRWAHAGVRDRSMLGQFCYRPTNGPGGERGGDPVPSSSMTAIGLLIVQYMGAPRSDPMLTGGVRHLMANLPDNKERNIYYWYYATQVMHNMSGPDWDAWNRRMRRVLVESQIKTGCASGSWDPVKPTEDAWGSQGGRLMLTSLACLTLEVYYRYLPLYRVEDEGMESPKGKRQGK